MTEQDLGRDPRTGKRLKREPTGDAAQNLHHVPAIHPLESARDYSRPHTIPADEYEDTTGQSHENAVTEWQLNEARRKQEQADLDRVDD